MRREAVYLEDIVRAPDDLAGFVVGKTPADLERDTQLRNAILFSLTVIGEAANSLSGHFHAAHGKVRWRDVIAMRNRIVHGYFSLDDALVWQIATIHTPILREQVVSILRKEFPDPA
jgi:uncharacterized protein with HEPN domain